MLDISVNKDKRGFIQATVSLSLSRRSAEEAANLFPGIPNRPHPPRFSLSFFLFCSHFLLISPPLFFSWPLPLHPPTSVLFSSKPFFSSLLSRSSSLFQEPHAEMLTRSICVAYLWIDEIRAMDKKHKVDDLHKPTASQLFATVWVWWCPHFYSIRCWTSSRSLPYYTCHRGWKYLLNGCNINVKWC